MGNIRRGSTRIKQAVESDQSEIREKMKKRLDNLKTLLLFSNATPIRAKKDGGYSCNLCSDQYFEPADLKRHFRKDHSDKNNLNKLTNRMFLPCAKLDVTFLNCALCDSNIDTIELLLIHLHDQHNKKIHAIKDNMLVPFKFESPGLRCAVCAEEYSNFKVLFGHMHTHYQNYVCDICSVGYSTKKAYLRHMQLHKATGASRAYKCRHCTKCFTSDETKIEHERRVHLGVKRHKCGICEEMFDDYYKKVSHLKTVHGQVQEMQACKGCDRKFASTKTLRVHVRKHHLMERNHRCTHCDKAFFSASFLSKHMICHVGGPKSHVCDVCEKAYNRRSSLQAHVRSHHGAPRAFSCNICSKTFKQKSSLKKHLMTEHGADLETEATNYCSRVSSPTC